MSDTPKDIIGAFADYAQIMNAVARHAADIAHARRALYQAYLSEGFTESQALDLCKVLGQ
jgi:hypothetical protein